MSWPMKPLGSVAKVVPGFAFKSKDLGEKGIPVIKIGSILDSRDVVPDATQCFPEEFFEERHKKFRLYNGDILLAMTGATAGKAGRIHSKGDECFLLNQRVAKIVPETIHPDFLWNIVGSDKYRSIFYGLGGGAAQPNMSGSQIESVEIPCPDFGTQERIANILSAYDDLIENNRRRIQLLEESARLLYKEWFVRLRFPGHEHVKVVDGVPEGWEKKPLSFFCHDMRNSINPADVPSETPYIGLEHIPRRSISLGEWGYASDVDSQKFKFSEGNILFGKIRPYFHKVGIAFVDGITSSDAIVIQPVSDELRMYLLMLLSSDGFVNLASQTVKEGSKMPRADWKYLLKCDFLRPPQSILSAFNSFVEPVIDQ